MSEDRPPKRTPASRLLEWSLLTVSSVLATLGAIVLLLRLGFKNFVEVGLDSAGITFGLGANDGLALGILLILASIALGVLFALRGAPRKRPSELAKHDATGV